MKLNAFRTQVLAKDADLREGPALFNPLPGPARVTVGAAAADARVRDAAAALRQLGAWLFVGADVCEAAAGARGDGERAGDRYEKYAAAVDSHYR